MGLFFECIHALQFQRREPNTLNFFLTVSSYRSTPGFETAAIARVTRQPSRSNTNIMSFTTIQLSEYKQAASMQVPYRVNMGSGGTIMPAVKKIVQLLVCFSKKQLYY